MKSNWASRSKFFLSLLVLLILAMLLSACNNDDANRNAGPDNKDSALRLEYWTPFSGGDNQFMTEMVDQFNSEFSNIHVVQVNSRLDDYYSRLRTGILSGNAPDVAIIHTTNLPQFVHNGYIEDLTIPAEEVDLNWRIFNPNILSSTVYDEKPYAVPLDTHALVMYYNKPFLRMAGVLDDTEKPIIAEGTEGFREFLQQIKDTIPADIAPMAQPSTRIDSVWLWWSIYNQMAGGGAFYNTEGTRALIDNEKSLKALTFINDLYQSELIPPNINDAFKLFYEGRAAVLITGMWGTGAFEQNDALDFGVVPVPVLFDHPAVWGDSHTLAVPTKHDTSDEKRKAILTFSRWMVEHGDMWAAAGHVPSVTEVVKSDNFNSLKFRNDYVHTANYVAYWPRHDKQWTIVELIIKEFEKMIYAQQSPEQALQAAVERINSELTK